MGSSTAAVVAVLASLFAVGSGAVLCVGLAAASSRARATTPSAPGPAPVSSASASAPAPASASASCSSYPCEQRTGNVVTVINSPINPNANYYSYNGQGGNVVGATKPCPRGQTSVSNQCIVFY